MAKELKLTSADEAELGLEIQAIASRTRLVNSPKKALSSTCSSSSRPLAHSQAPLRRCRSTPAARLAKLPRLQLPLATRRSTAKMSWLAWIPSGVHAGLHGQGAVTGSGAPQGRAPRPDRSVDSVCSHRAHGHLVAQNEPMVILSLPSIYGSKFCIEARKETQEKRRKRRALPLPVTRLQLRRAEQTPRSDTLLKEVLQGRQPCARVKF